MFRLLTDYSGLISSAFVSHASSDHQSTAHESMAHTKSSTLGLVTKHQSLHNYANNHTRKGNRERKAKRMTKTAVWFGGIYFPFETWLLQPQSNFIERKCAFAKTMLASVCRCQNRSKHSAPLSK